MYKAKYFHLLTLVLFLWLYFREHRICFLETKCPLMLFLHRTQLFNMHFIPSRSKLLLHFKIQTSFAYLEYIQIRTAFSHQWQLRLACQNKL